VLFLLKKQFKTDILIVGIYYQHAFRGAFYWYQLVQEEVFMKNKLMLIGIIALVALMGISLIGCGDKNDVEKAGLTGQWEKENVVLEFKPETMIITNSGVGTTYDIKIDGSKITASKATVGFGTMEFKVNGDTLTISAGTDGLAVLNNSYTKVK
jgi:hypothetical protein